MGNFRLYAVARVNGKKQIRFVDAFARRFEAEFGMRQLQADYFIVEEHGAMVYYMPPDPNPYDIKPWMQVRMRDLSDATANPPASPAPD